MILELTDLGAIKKMELDLSKNFILFCGPNSTGKTYASYILNAFLSNISATSLECHEEIYNEIVEEGKFKLKKQYIEEFLQSTCKEIKDSTEGIFGISKQANDELFENLDLKLSYDNEDYEELINRSVKTILSSRDNVISISKPAKSDIVKIERLLGDYIEFADPKIFTSPILFNKIISKLAFPNHYTSRMLTVERNSIYTFKTELSLSRNELIDNIQQHDVNTYSDIINILNKYTKRYTLAVRQSLSIANDLEYIQKQESDYAYIADEIENELLHGKVSMTKGGDVEFSAQSMSESKKIPFHLSSSIVKTMASLVIYLRHIAKKGDTIIVDEPEMNFHPDVQVLLSQIFAKLSNNGLHVVISTHSDYIIREVNNMIMAGALYNKGKAEKADECGYSKDCSLDKNSVEVIYFNPDHETGYVETQSLPIDDEGFAVSSIDKTIVEQNQRTESLYDSLYE